MEGACRVRAGKKEIGCRCGYGEKMGAWRDYSKLVLEGGGRAG